MELKKIWEIIEEAENMRNAYFFTPPQRASARRSYEEKHSHGPVTWDDNGHAYSAELSVICTCHNVYVRGNYSRDGKKTTLNAVKNSYWRLKGAEEEALGW